VGRSGKLPIGRTRAPWLAPPTYLTHPAYLAYQAYLTYHRQL
jgi:hypothetical protein